MPDGRVKDASGIAALQDADIIAKNTALTGTSVDATQENYMKEFALMAAPALTQLVIDELRAIRKDLFQYHTDRKYGAKP